jgi:hypothetical protein
MAYIKVDVNLEDFDTDDLIEEVEDRLDRNRIIQAFGLEELDNSFKDYPEGVDTVKDRMKFDLFMEHFDDITLEQLEQLVRN